MDADDSNEELEQLSGETQRRFFAAWDAARRAILQRQAGLPVDRLVQVFSAAPLSLEALIQLPGRANVVRDARDILRRLDNLVRMEVLDIHFQNEEAEVEVEVRVRFQSSPSSHRFTNYGPAKVIKETIL